MAPVTQGQPETPITEPEQRQGPPARIRVIGRGLWYISAAHTEADVDQAVSTAREVLAVIG